MGKKKDTHKTNIFMKNIFKTIVCAIIALAAISCENSEVNNDNRLATPNVGMNIIENKAILSWEAVDFAAYYEVSVNSGDVARTDECTYLIENLTYGESYTATVIAVAADQNNYKNSKPAVVEINMPERVAPQYREWYPTNGAAASAISNNGRYVVGAFDRQGFILDLNTDTMTELPNIELYDVADNGVAVGSSHGINPDGVPAIYENGTIIEVDVSNLAENMSLGSFTSITPDGKYAVGWIWDSGDTYYTQNYGEFFPISYNIATGTLSVPAVPNSLIYYSSLAGIAPKAVAPDRTILGYEQSLDMFNIIWNSESEPYDYVHLQYDSEYNPIECIGDSNNLFSPSGRYVYGKGKQYDADGYPTEYPAAFDRETGEVLWFSGGSVTAMTDSGIVFINDAPYYLGTTSYVVDINSGDLVTQTPIVDWLALEHDMGLGEYIQEGIIINGTSEDGKTLLGITNTMSGWLTFVIKIDGAPMQK